MNTTQLVANLRERGLIGAAAPAPVEADERPWFLSLLMGIAGWFAGIFVLVFLGLFFDVHEMKDLRNTGLALLGAAWVLYFAGRDRVFVDQLALALSIAGQLAMAAVFYDVLRDPLDVSLVILGMQLVLFGAMPDRVARTLSAFFACIAWVYAVRFFLRPGEGADSFLAANGHFVPPMFGVWTLPIEWFVSWLPIVAIAAWLRITETRWMARAPAAFARPALTGLILGLALAGIAAEPVSMLAPGIDSIGHEFSWWALFPLLSIALAMYAAFNAFLLRSQGLLGIAIVAALVHLGRFYYLYGTTLRVKSLIMAVSGAVLLAAGLWITRRAEVRP